MNRNITEVFAGLLIFLVLSFSAHAQGFTTLNIGSGGDADDTSLGWEIGTTNGMRGLPFAFELSAVFTDEHDDADRIESDIPHSDFTDLGWRNDGAEWGGILKTGLTTGSLTLLGGAGVGIQDRARVVRSNVTGWEWTEDEDTKAYFMWSAGARWIISRLVLSLDYNNRRGVVGGLGMAF